MTFLPLAAALAVAAATPNAPSPSDAELRDRVEAYLGAIHGDAVSAEHWKALGPRAVPILDEVAHDPASLPSRRARAVEALAAIGGDRARAVVLEVVRSEDEPFAIRASALRSAPRLLSATELSTQLQPVLERARDVPVRATAAEVLARHAGAPGCAAVRAQVERERKPERAHFSTAADRCGLRLP